MTQNIRHHFPRGRSLAASVDFGSCVKDLCSHQQGSYLGDLKTISDKSQSLSSEGSVLRAFVQSDLQSAKKLGQYVAETAIAVSHLKPKVQSNNILFWLSPFQYASVATQKMEIEVREDGILTISPENLLESFPSLNDGQKNLFLKLHQKFVSHINQLYIYFYDLNEIALSVTNLPLKIKDFSTEAGKNKDLLKQIMNGELKGDEVFLSDLLESQALSVTKDKALTESYVRDLVSTLLLQRVVLDYYNLAKTNRTSLIQTFDFQTIGKPKELMALATRYSDFWKSSLADIALKENLLQCHKAALTVDYFYPTKKEILEAKSFLEGIKKETAQKVATDFKKFNISLDKIEQMNVVLPFSASHMKESLLRELKIYSRTPGPFDYNSQSPLIQLLTLYFLGVGSDPVQRAGSMGQLCKNFLPPLFADASSVATNSFSVSPETLHFQNKFRSVSFHEVGHLVRNLLKNSSGTSNLNRVEVCLANQHTEVRKPIDRTKYISEDFADWFMAKNTPQATGFGCYLIKDNPAAQLLEAYPAEVHSSPLFRTLHIYFIQKGKLPKSCLTPLKTNPFKNCSYY